VLAAVVVVFPPSPANASLDEDKDVAVSACPKGDEDAEAAVMLVVPIFCTRDWGRFRI
jgi:hypothetical protein